ncbi:MAG TPA: hypothetical protein VK589_18740, partial [Chryseolinea sp.]|nr:hypothetical protein [Chryseolinea sp.]
MKYTFLVVSLMLLVTELPGQWMIPMNEDSLRTVLKNENGTTAVNVLIQLAGSYFFKQPATTLEYAKAAIDSSRRLKYEKGIIEGSVNAGEASRLLGDFVGGLRMQYQAYKLTGKADLEAYLAGGIGMNYYELKHHKKSLTSLKRAIAILKNLPPDAHGALYFVYAARNYIATKGYDSARLFLKDAAKYLQLEGSRMTVRWKMLYHIAFGDYYDGTGLPDSAYFYWKAALKIAANDKDVVPNHLSMTLAKLSSVFSLRNEIDSSLYYARRAFKIATIAKLNPRILQTSRQLADLYRKMDNKDSILFYQDIAIAVNESI